MGGVEKSTLSNYLKQRSQPSQLVLQNWVREYRIDANWLLTGDGPMFRGEQKETAIEASYEIKSLGHNGQIRRAQVVRGPEEQELGAIIDVHAEAGAGPARARWEPEPIAKVCVPPEYAKPGVFGLRIKGSSMEPLINRGAFVGVNSEDREFVSGDIYAVFIPHEGLTVKRLFVEPSEGAYILRSINPDHPDMKLPVEQCENLIVGRVVWVLQAV